SLGKRRLVLERGEADPRSIAAEPDLVGHALLDRTHVGLTVVQCYLESGATAVPLVRLDVPRGSRQVVPEGRAERPQLRSVLALRDVGDVQAADLSELPEVLEVSS